MAGGKGLFCSLVVTDRVLQYLLLNGRMDKSPCEGWVGSFTMLVAFLIQRVV